MRIGLQPILRRVWSKRGERPIATVRTAYDWTYVYGFVRPATGDTEWLILPTVSTDVFQIALDHFAEAVSANEKKRIILILEGAGWHKSNQLIVPRGVHLLFLPPYSPELQPAEKLWPLIREAAANQQFKSIEELENVIEARCRRMTEEPELIRGHTLYHWWKNADPKPVELCEIVQA